MHPILFEVGSFTIYTYGFCIAIGALLGLTYMTLEGKKQFGLTFDTTNVLFILIVAAAIAGALVSSRACHVLTALRVTFSTCVSPHHFSTRSRQR